MKWKESLIKQVIIELKSDDNWKNVIKKIKHNEEIGVHLAVFNEPFLSLIFSGDKKIESRFSKNKISPYKKIHKGDVVVLKASGGPVLGLFLADDVKFYNGTKKDWLNFIESKYSEQICSEYDPLFWNSKSKSQFATLISVKNVKKINPFKIDKTDRTGWSVIIQRNIQYTIK
jgi:hypothetical protein